MSIYKFYTLSEKQKHKFAAIEIRKVYLNKEDISLYRRMEEDLSLPPVELSKENLSHRYHFHLDKAGIQKKRDFFSPQCTPL